MGAADLRIGESAEHDEHHRAFGEFARPGNRDQKNLRADNIGHAQKHRHEHPGATDKKNDQRQPFDEFGDLLHALPRVPKCAQGKTRARKPASLS